MKKILSFIAIIVLAFVLIGCVDKDGSTGSVQIKIYDFEAEEVFNKEISFGEEDSLLALLKNHKTIKMQGEESTFGFFIVEMVGISSNDYESSFWNIKVNGEDSLLGISEIDLEDGEVIEFHLISWQ